MQLTPSTTETSCGLINLHLDCGRVLKKPISHIRFHQNAFNQIKTLLSFSPLYIRDKLNKTARWGQHEIELEMYQLCVCQDPGGVRE